MTVEFAVLNRSSSISVCSNSRQNFSESLDEKHNMPELARMLIFSKGNSGRRLTASCGIPMETVKIFPPHVFCANLDWYW